MSVAAGPASAGVNPSVKVAKHRDGPYTPSVGANVTDARFRTFYVKTRGQGTEPVDAHFRQQQGSLSFKVRYFKGTANITDAVTNAGYPFTLKPDKATRFTLKLKAKDDPPASGCFGQEVSIDGGGSATLAVILANPPASCSF